MKKRYLFMALVYVSLNATVLASSVEIGEEWNKTYEGMGWIKDIQETQDRGYIFASSKPSGPLQTILLVKTDEKGKELWNRTFGEPGYNEVISIVETENDGYILSGFHRKELDPNQDVIPPLDLRIIRIDTSGNQLWNMTLEGGRAYPLDTTSDGGLIIAGETGLIFSDLWLSRVAADGKEIWKKTFEHGEKLVRTDAVHQTSDGGYLIAGKNISCCGWGDFDLWLAKTDTEGDVQWKKSFEEFRYVSIYSIYETSDGDYIFAGNFGCELWIRKFDQYGNKRWSRNYKGFGYKHFQEMTDGGYLASSEDGIMKIDAEGNIQWIVDSKETEIISLKQTSDGGLIKAGNSDSDIWLIKLKRGTIPFISFIPNLPGAGQGITFDASLSYDPDGKIRSYIWDFGDGNKTVTPGKKIVHSYASDGKYNVSLMLKDKNNNGIGSSTIGLEVQRSIPPEERWNRTYGGKDADGERSVGQTSDGGYIMAGDTSFLYGIGAYLVKVDSDGNEEWNITYAVIDGQTDAKSVEQTSDGGYVFAGSINLHSEHSQMIWLVKTDRFGNEQWNRTFGRPGSIDDFSYNVGFSAIENSNGSYIVTGITNLVGGPADPRFGLILGKTDKDGNKLWEKTWDLSGSSEGYSVIESIDGGYTVVGTTSMVSLMTTGAWLLKVDQNGNEKWLKTYSGTGTTPMAYSINQTMDGGYIIAGNMWKYEATTGNIINVWMMKTDRDGNTLWQKTYDEKDYGSARSVRQSKDGGYLILADGSGAGFWLIKTDANGSVRWHNRFEGNNPSSVIETSDSGYIIGGVKDDSCGNHGSDFWLIKLGGSSMADGYSNVVKETPGREGQPDVVKAQGFEWILMIFAMMAAVAARKR